MHFYIPKERFLERGGASPKVSLEQVVLGPATWSQSGYQLPLSPAAGERWVPHPLPARDGVMVSTFLPCAAQLALKGGISPGICLTTVETVHLSVY